LGWNKRMNDEKPIPEEEVDFSRRARRSWIQKFSDACRGVKIAVRAEVSFFVHLFITMIVVLTGAVLGLSRLEWCLIVLCIATTLSAEMFNTAIEKMARVVTQETNPEIRDVLDIASGAVLLIALGAAVLGVLILSVHALELVSF